MKTCTIKQWNAITSLIDINKAHFKEVKFHELPNDAIHVGYELAPYGDWNYYVTTNGEFICTYYNIGD